jgi:hypothetical protein
MKKVFIGMLALGLLSASSAFADAGKKVKKARFKSACTTNCVPGKDCKKNSKCPIMPGCCQ